MMNCPQCNITVTAVLGLDITRLRELINLFEKRDYDIRSEEGFRDIKRDFFNIVEDTE